MGSPSSIQPNCTAPDTNEEVVGAKALKPIRDKVVIATKFGFNIEKKKGGKKGRKGGIQQPTRAHQEVADESWLRRLEIEVIDLLLSASRRSGRADRRRRRSGEGPYQRRAKSGTSVCPNQAPKRYGARTQFSPSRPCRTNTRSGRADPKKTVS